MAESTIKREKNPIGKAYRKWLCDSPEGVEERQAIQERLDDLREKWERKM